MIKQRIKDESIMNVRTEYCKTQFSCEKIDNSFLFLCPFNSFCNSLGKCQKFKEEEQHGKSCNVEFSLKISRYEYCNGKGLSCISKRCKICNEGEEVNGLDTESIYKLSLFPFHERKPLILVKSSCINQEWSISTWNVKNHFTTILFVIFSSLSGVFLLLFYLKNVLNFLNNNFEF